MWFIVITYTNDLDTAIKIISNDIMEKIMGILGMYSEELKFTIKRHWQGE